jgi:flagellar protein FlaG
VDINSINGSGYAPGLGAAYRAPASPTQSLLPSSPVPGSAEKERAVAETVGKTAQPAVTEQALQVSVDKLNEFISPYVTALQFQIDKDSGGKLVVRIMDTETKEVIKQFPNEKVLALAKALTEVLTEAWDKPEGLLVEQDV